MIRSQLYNTKVPHARCLGPEPNHGALPKRAPVMRDRPVGQLDKVFLKGPRCHQRPAQVLVGQGVEVGGIRTRPLADGVMPGGPRALVGTGSGAPTTTTTTTKVF